MELFNSIDLGKLPDLLLYNPNKPMIFSSGLFFFLFIAFAFIYFLLRKQITARIIYVALFSLYFYYKSSGVFFLLLIFTATSDFIIGRGLAKSSKVFLRKSLVALSLILNLGMLSYFKYFNFLRDAFFSISNELFNLFGQELPFPDTPDKLNIFLPVGISFFTFQSLSYIIDIYRDRIKPLNRWIDYLFYISFFPQLVAGPIVRARDFIPQIHRKVFVSKTEFGEGIYLIICGLIKKAVLSDYISINFVDRIFDAPLLYTGVENLLGVYGYALQIYCDFSGYSDMAIGIALLLGFRFNINFDSPYQSATITEFWRRWHISLSSWLKDYLYISLGGNRKGRIRTYFNLLITMLLGGLWHGAAWRFILWGTLHGVSLAIHKFMISHFGFKKDAASMGYTRRFLGRIITFHLVCFGWIFFRASDMNVAFNILSQIISNFHPEVFLQFIEGYSTVFILMLLGYLIHFIPKRIDLWTQRKIERAPLLLQAVLMVITIFIVIQMQSAEVQPFIYFQF